MDMYKKIKLNNGLTIITHEMQDRASAGLGIWIRTGGRYENFVNKGISHYLEHLLFKGTKKYSCRKIKEAIEGVGGSLNGFTSEELTCYMVKMPCRYLDLGLDILSDMVLNPLLRETDIDKERTVILEELKMYRDLPQSYVYDLLDEQMWPKHPLGASIIGSAETINAVNSRSMSAYKKAYYTAPNIVVAAAGCLNQNKIEASIKKAFSSLEESSVNEYAAAQDEQDTPQLKLLQKDTEQTHLALGFHSFKRGDWRRHAQGLLHVILGANMSSRLFDEVREKNGLAYEIGTQVKRMHDTGSFIVHAGVDNCKFTRAVDLILKELARIKIGLVSEDEFKRAKEFYLGQLALALEDTMDQMLWIGESQATLDRTYTLEEITHDVNKVTRQDIRDIARIIFKEEKINLAAIGPLKEGQKKIYSRLKLK